MELVFYFRYRTNSPIEYTQDSLYYKKSFKSTIGQHDFNILETFQILRKILLPFIYTYSLFFCFFIFSSRSLRNSKYAGLINIHKNDVISIAKKHENFDFEKQYSKLICSIVVCKQGQYCSSEVCPRLSRKSSRRVRKSITQQVGDSSKESFLIIFSYFLKMLTKT